MKVDILRIRAHEAKRASGPVSQQVEKSITLKNSLDQHFYYETIVSELQTAEPKPSHSREKIYKMRQSNIITEGGPTGWWWCFCNKGALTLPPPQSLKYLKGISYQSLPSDDEETMELIAQLN